MRFAYKPETQLRLDDIDAEIARVGQHVDLTGPNSDRQLAEVQKLMFQCATGFIKADDKMNTGMNAYKTTNKTPNTTTTNTTNKTTNKTTYTVDRDHIRDRIATTDNKSYLSAIHQVLKLEELVCKLVRKKSMDPKQNVRQQAYFVGLLLYALAKYVTESETLKKHTNLAKLANKIFIHVKTTTIKAMCPIVDGRVPDKAKPNAFEGEVMSRSDEQKLNDKIETIRKENQLCGK